MTKISTNISRTITANIERSGGVHCLDKLAQLRKTAPVGASRASKIALTQTEIAEKRKKIVDIKEKKEAASYSKKRLDNKNKRKWFTKNIASKLMKLDTPLKHYYQNAYSCNDILIEHHGKLTAKYCNTRICNVCNSIRTGKLINGYQKPIAELYEPYFVTLTLPSVKAADLREHINEMKGTFTQIRDYFRKRSEKELKEDYEFKLQRNDAEYWAAYMQGTITEKQYKNGCKDYSNKEKRDILNKPRILKNDILKGIRSLEVTYNTNTKMFHPHFHLVCEGGKEQANEVIKQWLKRNKKAVRDAQDARPLDKNNLNEIFKYTTKIIGNSKKKASIELYAVDTITRALYGMRTFQTYGGIRRISEDIDEIQSQTYEHLNENTNSVIWIYETSVNSWVNEDGEIINNFKEPENLKKIAANTGKDPTYKINYEQPDETIEYDFKNFKRLPLKEVKPYYLTNPEKFDIVKFTENEQI